MVDTSTRAGLGPARVLIALYALFVLASGSRAAVQLSTQFSVAPLAYVLSGVSAAVYVVGLVLLIGAERGRWRRATAWWCRLEVSAVVVIGGLSLARPAGFGDQTVWSAFGRGYWFVPLLLPVAALWWLHAAPAPTTPSSAPRSTGRRAGWNRRPSRRTGTAASRR